MLGVGPSIDIVLKTQAIGNMYAHIRFAYKHKECIISKS